MPKRPASYILPAAIDETGTTYMLLGEEADDKTWSGFGGGLEGDETFKEAAVREGFEEAMGLIGSKASLRENVRKFKMFPETAHQYWLLHVPWNPALVQQFSNVRAWVLSCQGVDTLSKACMEKSAAAWVPLQSLVDALDQGRRLVGSKRLGAAFFEEMSQVRHLLQ